MREQRSHQMEGVIKRLMVKITSLMEGRAIGQIARRGTEDIPNSGDKMFSHYFTSMYVPPKHRLSRYHSTKAQRQGRQPLARGGGWR